MRAASSQVPPGRQQRRARSRRPRAPVWLGGARVTGRVAARVLLLSVLCGASVIGGARALAAPAAPAAGAPDPAQMVLAPADFAPGAIIVSQGYQSNAASLPSYQRVFAPAATRNGALFLTVSSQVTITTDPITAAVTFGVIRDGVTSPSGRAQLVRTLVQGFNKGLRKGPRIRARDVRVGRALGLAVGDDSLFVSLSARVRGVRFHLDLVLVRVDRAIGSLTLAFLGHAARVATVTSLTRAMAAHMQAVLSSQGNGTGTPTGTG
jgi:hypothetical protein